MVKKFGTAPSLVDSLVFLFLGRGLGQFLDSSKFDRRKFVQGCRASAPVVYRFDLAYDFESQVYAGFSPLLVQHVVLQDREKRCHYNVITGCTDSSPRVAESVFGEFSGQILTLKLATSIRMHDRIDRFT